MAHTRPTKADHGKADEIKSVKSAYHQNGKLVSGATWTYGYLNSPTKDQYLVVYYQ